MTQIQTRQSIAQRARCWKDGFRSGWEDAGAQRRPRPELSAEADRGLGLFMVLVLGYLAVDTGVDLLPWGESGGMTAALVSLAAVLIARRFRGRWIELALIGVVIACAAFVARSDLASTSMVLAGATIAAITQTAQDRPFLYGAVIGMFLFGLVIQIFDLAPFGAVELIFSGEAYSPAGAARQTTVFAAIVLLFGLIRLMGSEMRKETERAEAAEDARDEAAADERARIARELHDVVSHHVTAMTLQAEAAAATGDRQALESLATSGREAAAELRRMLGVLRRPAGDSAVQTADPQPRLDDLDALAHRLTGGLQVHLERTGRVRSLPAGVELCAFRVIQEALTNVAKHSDARDASVTVDYGSDHLSLEILDDGTHLRAPSLDDAGHGLIGMRERVTLLDGELAAGPREEGRGYRVFARIPL